MDRMEKDSLFETMRAGRALLVMAVPTIASQMIILLYNLADTWFIGRTNDPYMVGASSLAVTVYYALVALANVFGTGGGSLMVRLAGEKRTDDARRVSSYSAALSALTALAFSILVLVTMDPLLRMLGASSNTLPYARQYVLATTVIGGLPTVLSMAMPQLIRNAGYAKEAGIGVALGSLMNVLLDPLFMFVLLPKGHEVLGAGIATMLSNFISLVYFVIIFVRLRDRSVLMLPKRIERLSSEEKRSLYSVGIPSALAIFLFDLVTIVINRLTASYGDIPLAAMGIVLKLERIPVNTCLGICLAMVPLVAYSYGAGDRERMRQVFTAAARAALIFSAVCAAVFFVSASPLISVFIKNEETVMYGAQFLRGRCFALPFMTAGYLVVNYMNAVDKGKLSFMLAVIRHIMLLIPFMLVMNHIWGLTGLVWSEAAADLISAVISVAVYRRVTSIVVNREEMQPFGK